MKLKAFRNALALSAVLQISGCGVGAATNASNAVFTGNVSVGATLTEGGVIVTDSSTPARTFTAPVMADGSYSVNVSGGVAPFLFYAHGGAGFKPVEIFSASAANSGKVDITPLTSLVVASAAGLDCAVAACTPATFTAARLSEAETKVQTQLAPLLTQFVLAIADAQDSGRSSMSKTRKWVFFKHIAVGGYVYSREGPLEFVKDPATGNWRMAGAQAAAGAKAGKGPPTYAPPPGASSFGNWLPFSADSSIYPDGATLIVATSSSISPAVTLVYSGRENGATRMAGKEMADTVADLSFIPACPRPTGQTGSCIDVAQTGGVYTAAFRNPVAAVGTPAIRQKFYTP
jgi:hypothetical protein